MIFRNRLKTTIFLLFLVLGGISTSTQTNYAYLGEPPKLFEFPVISKQEIETSDIQVYLPIILSPAEPLPWVDILDKDAVEQLYVTEYMTSEGVSSGWTGNHANCNPGTTSDAFREAVLRRINYFRSMSGIPPVTAFKDEYNQRAQSAALMMSTNKQLDHTPPETWLCYSADGYEGASSSNLYLGVYGPSAISGYVYDPGSGNYPVGHRRWILYPQTQYMGTGDVPSQDGYPASNALWVFDRDNMWGERPTTREAFVAWPPAGYVPRQVVYPRWSFSYPQADFANAMVTITRSDQTVGVSVSPVVNGYGENTLVWELNEAIPEDDVVYGVTIGNVLVNGVAQAFTYQVRIITLTHYENNEMK